MLYEKYWEDLFGPMTLNEAFENHVDVCGPALADIPRTVAELEAAALARLGITRPSEWGEFTAQAVRDFEHRRDCPRDASCDIHAHD